jgi:mannose-6-phosphate isomerase class I
MIVRIRSMIVYFFRLTQKRALINNITCNQLSLQLHPNEKQADRGKGGVAINPSLKLKSHC